MRPSAPFRVGMSLLLSQSSLRRTSFGAGTRWRNSGSPDDVVDVVDSLLMFASLIFNLFLIFNTSTLFVSYLSSHASQMRCSIHLVLEGGPRGFVQE